jgi:glycosyltransferase involved in cell wall biosynthesis
MVFVGRGADLEEIKEYVEDLGLTEDVIFTGSISDRELLKCWYCRSDLFLFPSVYDTNGLVVREAAACSVPSVLVKGSCAAEGVTDGVNGYLIEENAASMAEKLISLYPCGDAVKQVGEGAARDLYLSWHDAVVTASERYEIVLDKYRSGGYPRKPEFSRDLYAALGTWMDRLGRAEKRISEVKDSIWNT